MNEALKNPFDDFGFSEEAVPSEEKVAVPDQPHGAATDLFGSDISGTRKHPVRRNGRGRFSDVAAHRQRCLAKAAKRS